MALSNSLAFILRNICFRLCFNTITYYPGMFFVRLARALRKNMYRQSNEEEFHIVKFAGTIKMKVDKNSYMGGSIFWSGFHHLNELLFLKKFLTPSMTFVDIGANQGEFSLFAASKLVKGLVLSFEPVTKQRNLLETNLQLNSFQNIKVYPFGLSNENSILPLYTSLNSTLHSGIHDGLSSLYQSEGRSHFQETAEIKIFDDIFFNSLEHLDFIKIDIEGAELFALKGMQKSIEKFKPVILIEINEETFGSAGYKTQDILIFMKSFNYKVHHIKKGNLSAINDYDILEYGNYIFKV